MCEVDVWIEREIRTKLQEISDSRPCLLLTGPRQTGKSSLLQRQFPGATYVTFDHLRYVEAATASPQEFLNQFRKPVILDEIQYVPGIFRELKILIDADRSDTGKWLLAGSQQFGLMEKASESLAGRMSIMHLETLSAAELRNSEISGISDYLWIGGYPELWAGAKLNITDFFESYLRSYVERDLKQIIDVKNLTDFRRFLRIAATRVGQLVNFRSLSSDVGVSDVTIRKWLMALQISGIVYLLSPYYANIGKRLVKSPKLYFADHGLLCYLLGIENREDWNAHVNRGNLWENLVLMELIKSSGLRPGEDLFFYRDQNGVEIDFLVERKGKLSLIEAKSSERIASAHLNFAKVAPLFSGRFKLRCYLAQNISDSMVIPTGSADCFNPIYTSIPL